MTKGLVSVIVPVYNVEKYLDRCLNSIVNQTYANLEILLIDDGSPDNCPTICDEWAKKDKRIRVIHKKNAGLGMARNTGIENSSGEYFIFCDSDECIEPELAERCYAAAVKYGADTVLYGMNRVDSSGRKVSSKIPYSAKEVYTGEEIKNIVLPAITANAPEDEMLKYIDLSAWASFFSARLIHESGWRFVSEREIISEDVFSLLGLYKNVKTVSVLSEAFYNYYMNSSSLTQVYRSDRFDKIKDFYQKSIILCDECGYNEEIKRRISYPFMAFTTAAMKQVMAAGELGYKQKRTVIKEIISDNYVQNGVRNAYINSSNAKRRLLGRFILNKNVTACCILLWLQNRKLRNNYSDKASKSGG